MAEQANARDQRQPGHRIEHGAPDVVERVVGLEILLVLAGVSGDLLFDLMCIGVEIVGVRSRQHHRAGLDANRQVRRADAGSRERFEPRRIDEIRGSPGEVRKSLTIRSKPPSPKPMGDRASQHRGYVTRRGKPARHRDRASVAACHAWRMAFRDRDMVDHAFIGLLRRFAKSEDAMLVEDQSFDGRVGLEHLGRKLGEIEARHDVGHEAQRRPNTDASARALSG